MAEIPITLSYKKRFKQDDFVIYGPAELMPEEGRAYPVQLKNGRTKQAFIHSLGAPFPVEGVLCRYGYLTPKNQDAGPAPDGRRERTSAPVRTVTNDDHDFMPDEPAAGWDDFQSLADAA